MIYQPKTHTFSGQSTPGFFTIAVQLTRCCNYKCLHCSESSFLPSITTEQMLIIIDKLSAHNVQRINISGGEPTLRTDWLKIVEYMATKNLVTSLATNCSQLNKAKIAKLKGLVSNIRVSIYGDEETHDYVTQVKGSLAKTLEVVKEAKEAGIPVYACVAVMQKNLPQLETIQKICSQHGIEKLLAYSLVPKGRGATIFEKEGVSRSEVATALRSTKTNPEIYWSPFDQNGICALIQADGTLVATPYSGESQVKYVGNAITEEFEELWRKYPFRGNYLSFSTEKLKCGNA